MTNRYLEKIAAEKENTTVNPAIVHEVVGALSGSHVGGYLAKRTGAKSFGGRLLGSLAGSMAGVTLGQKAYAHEIKDEKTIRHLSKSAGIRIPGKMLTGAALGAGVGAMAAGKDNRVAGALGGAAIGAGATTLAGKLGSKLNKKPLAL